MGAASRRQAKHQGVTAARETRERLADPLDDPLPCVLTMIERDLGIPVALLAGLPREVSGYCARIGDQHLIFVNGEHAYVRQRFTLAHELGHVILGDGVPTVDKEADLEEEADDLEEIAANAFASEFLAPAEAVHGHLPAPPSLDDLICFGARFGISTEAAWNRARLVGVLDDALPHLDPEETAEAWSRLQPRQVDDEVARAGRSLPRLSPSLADSALASLLRGDGSVDVAARAAGVHPDALRDALALISAT